MTAPRTAAATPAAVEQAWQLLEATFGPLDRHDPTLWPARGNLPGWDSLGHVRLTLRLRDMLPSAALRHAAQRVETMDDIARLLDHTVPAPGEGTPRPDTPRRPGEAAAPLPGRGSGLRDVSIGTTGISQVDDGVEPTYRGYRLSDLARHATFDEVVAILVDGDLAAAGDPATPGLLDPAPLAAARPGRLSEAEYLTHLLGLLPDRRYTAADARGALHDLAGALAGYTGFAVPPDAGLPARLLAACLPRDRVGLLDDPRVVRSFERDLIIHCEHGLCASALAARVAASSGSAVGACLAAAAHTFTGPRHGGALPAIAAAARRLRDPEQAGNHLREVVFRTGAAPGFGHAVYRGEDPRCALYREIVETGGYRVEQDDGPGSVALLVNAGRALADVGLYPNVDLYTALLYQRLGLRHSAYLPAFLLARTVGWLAHAAEAATSPLIRPRLTYRGYQRTFVRVPRNLSDLPDGDS